MKKVYYSRQTELATTNFPFSVPHAQKELVYAIAAVKKATATANYQTGFLSSEIMDAIVVACDEIIAGTLDDQFITPALQGGAGTSIHMNANEVIAGRATDILREQGVHIRVHPNDHVNRSQSTNDVNPSALKIACIRLLHDLIATLDTTERIFGDKAEEFAPIAKLGRTHLQDAVPTTLGDELAAYQAVVKRHGRHLRSLLPYLHELNVGGTAIGNSINATPEYIEAAYETLREVTGLPVQPAENLMSQTSSQTDFVMVSQALVSLTMDMSKIANDIRLMASGPNGGFGEIQLPSLQPGSSIMPGKVNPILPESVNQLYFVVSGNNLTIEHASQAAQLELGVMLPISADRLLTSLRLTNEVIDNFMHKCVAGIVANKERCREHLEKSTAYATMLTPSLGYDVVSKAVKEAVAKGMTIREVMLTHKYMDEHSFDRATTLVSKKDARTKSFVTAKTR